MHFSAPSKNPSIGVKEQENSSCVVPLFLPFLPISDSPLRLCLSPSLSFSLSASPRQVGCLKILTDLLLFFFSFSFPDMIENILVNKSGAELAGESSKTDKQHKTNNTTEEMGKEKRGGGLYSLPSAYPPKPLLFSGFSRFSLILHLFSSC